LQGLHAFAAQGFLAAHGLQGLHAFAAQGFLAAHGLQGLHAFAAHGLLSAAVIRRGIAHLLPSAPPAAHGLHGFAAAHGLHGLAAAHGLHGFAATRGAQGFFAAAQGFSDWVCAARPSLVRTAPIPNAPNPTANGMIALANSFCFNPCTADS
jgi:hypothetical protein